MRYAVKNLSQILEPSNKHGCMSALRATNSCYKCSHYPGLKYSERCKSRVVNEEYERLLNVKSRLQEGLRKVEKRMKRL